MSDEGQLGGYRSAPADHTYDGTHDYETSNNDTTNYETSNYETSNYDASDTYDRDLTSDHRSAPTPQASGQAAPSAESAVGSSLGSAPDPAAPDPSVEPATAPRTGWERSLFEGDQGPGVPGYAPVEPSGPRTPPKPGTPSSGNLRLPDWMREEMSGGRAEDAGDAGRGSRARRRADRADRTDRVGHGDHDVADEDHERTRLMLYFGVGLLVVALIAAGAVYVLKKVGGGDDADGGPAPGTGASGAATSSARPPDVALPPNKPLMRFRGRHDRAVGVLPDRHAGVAYPRLGAPWQIPGRKSGLGRVGWSGQQVVVTEQSGGRPKWYGQLLSGTLSEAQRTLYAGSGTERQAAVALATQYDTRFYSFPHKSRSLASQPLTVDGHRGWLVASYIGYHQPGIKATAEVVVVAVVNTGRPSPAVIYMAIPNTNRALWPDINYVFASLRLTA